MEDIKQLLSNQQTAFQAQAELYHQLAKGQSPKFMMISCCDSRVSPTKILAVDPGEIFMVRSIANLVPSYAQATQATLTDSTGAAIEFAVKHLKVKHIIVLGHSSCGGIKRLMEAEATSADTHLIDPWVVMAKSAKDEVIKKHADQPFVEQCRLGEQAAIRSSLRNLLTFEFVNSRVTDEQLFLHGWHFNIGSGELLAVQGEDFLPIAEVY